MFKALLQIFAVYIIAITTFVLGAENGIHPANTSQSENAQIYHFNQDSEMSESYPERAAIYALSNTKKQSTLIPKKLRKIIYEFAHDPLCFLSDQQRDIIRIVEVNMNEYVMTEEWIGLRIHFYTEKGWDYIEIAAHCNPKNPSKQIVLEIVTLFGNMTQSERDCMNQMLLRRNSRLTIQKCRGDKILYSYTSDRALHGGGVRSSYLDSNVNYCCDRNKVLTHDYKYNPFPGDSDYSHYEDREKKQQHACMHCGKITKKKCAICKKTYYCSMECQREHYPEHKLNCTQYNFHKF